MNTHTPTAPATATATATAVAVPRKLVYGAAAAGLLALGAAGATLIARAPADKPEPVKAAAVAPAPAPATASGRSKPGGVAPTGPGGTVTPLATQPAAGPAVCAHCGVVEAVQTVQHKGEGTGLGAVAGGVLGGAVGSQMGKGKGRNAMTVLGAVGGGLAGHEIEKRQRSTTSYRVKVRMDDGSLRTVSRAESVSVGARVTVDGSTLRLRQEAAADPAGAPRTLRTGGALNS